MDNSLGNKGSIEVDRCRWAVMETGERGAEGWWKERRKNGVANWSRTVTERIRNGREARKRKQVVWDVCSLDRFSWGRGAFVRDWSLWSFSVVFPAWKKHRWTNAVFQRTSPATTVERIGEDRHESPRACDEDVANYVIVDSSGLCIRNINERKEEAPFRMWNLIAINLYVPDVCLLRQKLRSLFLLSVIIVSENLRNSYDDLPL